MKFLNLLFLVLFSSTTLIGQTIHHNLSMPAPETHYFHVETVLTNFKEKELVMVMPVWSPGSYLVREYPKNVNIVRAKDEYGKALKVTKVRKNQWKIEKGKAKKVTVNYEVYAFELTVRTSFLDQTHGFLNGVNVFMYPEGHKQRGGKLSITPHSSFSTISAPLETEKDGFVNDSKTTTFLFKDFDELADTPIEIGNQTEFTFDASGVKHTVAMYGVANYDIEKLKVDMAKIVDAATEVYGQNPNKDYLFIIHNVVDGGGGLEHMNSTTLSVNRWTYDEANYNRFLSLVAHEYIHVWLVKRLRPSVLVDYDYNRENFTDLLWVMEGFTSYYDKLLLRRAGFYSEEEYVRAFQGVVNWVEGSAGNKVQPVSHSSYDAWIKAYMPNENSGNTTISYYSKGGIIAAVFDAMIIKKSNGKLSLDDFMRKLYSEFYEKKNIGITEASFKKTLSAFVDEDLDVFFDRYINGTEEIPYEKYFTPIGVNVVKTEHSKLNIGLNVSDKNGRLIVNSVLSGSPAEKAGLSPNDEIIAFNGFRVNADSYKKLVNGVEEGEEFNLIISRDEQLGVINVKADSTDSVSFMFSASDHKLAKFWLRGK